jgi:hypothetical protein
VLPPADGHEWLSLTADDGSTWLVDVTFVASGYGCIYGRGCPGIDHAAPASHGCCNHGAHLADGADRRTTARYAARLRADEWQHRRRARAKGGPFKRVGDDGWMTRLVDGACIFLNRADHPGGPGCALHQAALARGERPMDWKPDVCWQVPVRLDIHTDDHGHDTFLLRAWERRDWGEGGADFDWWCTEEAEAYGHAAPLYRTMAAELAELMGDELYQRLCALLDARSLERVAGTAVTLGVTRHR